MQKSKASAKVALITGSGEGIGRAIAARFVSKGFNVVIAEKNPVSGRRTAKELGPCALFIHCDVAREADVKNMVSRAVKTFGRIDVLVNNAGIFDGGDIEKLPFKTWEKVIGINLSGAFLCAKYCAPHLKKSRGAIVSISSTRALVSEAGNEGYAASKAGLVGLTHSLAISLGPNVRANCICPGWIDTGKWGKMRKIDHTQHPCGRVGRPEDIAAMVEFLADPKNGFITGAAFVVDGGMTRKMIYV